MPTTNRQQFRDEVYSRDDGDCIVPWCPNKAVDAHHIIERELWENGGYSKDNGASVCEKHHRYAEGDLSETGAAVDHKDDPDIPPQAFWRWAGITDPPLPETAPHYQINKWGREYDTPRHEHLRDRIKYQSSRHLLPLYWHDDTLAAERIENDDTELSSVSEFVGVPLVITQKIDGGNCMLVSDVETPVRARNGSSPTEAMKPLYRDGGLYWTHEVNQKLPERLQVFGEWVREKHSIHYGCECDNPCDDIGPYLSELIGVDDESAYLQIFGVYDTKFNTWLSWPKTEEIASELGFPTTPVIYQESAEDEATFNTEHEAISTLTEMAHNVIEDGGEGIVVRKKYPFHYGQFGCSLGKYVRENHVADGAKHHKHTKTVVNNI